MDEFEQIAADLEKSIKVDETVDLTDPAQLKTAIAKAVATLLAKAKGAQTTDLDLEGKPKKKTVTETEGDPAEHPVKSGQGYKDSASYKKGDEDADDDGDADDDDDRPSYFGKKAKGKKAKKGKKVEKSDESDDDSEVEDVTEFMQDMSKAVDDLGDRLHTLSKSINDLKEGSAIFGSVLHQVAENDPRRDNLIVTMAKALASIHGEVKDLKKSVASQNDLVKAVAEMPGVPRAAGLSLLKSEADGADAGAGASGAKLSKGDHERLYKAAVQKSITREEYREALAKGDSSILQKVFGK